MCGIFGIIVKEGSYYNNNFLKKSLIKLANLSQSRGKDSSGLCNINYQNNSFDIIKGPIPANHLLKRKKVSNVHYFTDTGRKWDGEKVSVRDKVKTNNDITFSSTKDIIRSAKNGTLPKKIMFTFHPQRWNDNLFYWVKELILQNLKNIIKRLILVK